jgi:transcriptional regulator GlxA family with amidase domain
VGDAGADVPAADGRDSSGGKFLGVESHGSVVAVCSGVPVDAVATVRAVAGLRAADETGGAVGGDAQGP